MGQRIVQALPIQLHHNEDGVDGIVIYQVEWPDDYESFYFMSRLWAETCAQAEREFVVGTVNEIIVWNDPLGDEQTLNRLRGSVSSDSTASRPNDPNQPPDFGGGQ